MRRPPNNGMQRTALRAAADAGRCRVAALHGNGGAKLRSSICSAEE